MRKRMTIEDAVRWAYTRELPKAGASKRPAGPASYASPGSLVDEVAELWALADNQFGLAIDLTAESDPHPDAIAIHEAVLGLDAIQPTLRMDWQPAPELAGLGVLAEAAVVRAIESETVIGADGQRRLRRRVSDIVRSAAILGVPEASLAELPVAKLVCDRGMPKWFLRKVIFLDNGAPYEVEVDGFDRKRRIPMPGAYQKQVLDPDPHEALCARARYQVWRAGMDVLFEDLAGRLDSLDLTECGRPWAPWCQPGEAPRILADLPQKAAVRAPMGPSANRLSTAMTRAA